MAPKKESPLPAPIITPGPVPPAPPQGGPPAPPPVPPAPPAAPNPPKPGPSLDDDEDEEVAQTTGTAVPADPDLLPRRAIFSEDIKVDRFKLKPEKCKKNRAYKDNEMDLQEMEHIHFYDSHNRRGEKQDYCEFSCGHKHKVSYKTDGKGNILASSLLCGPALMERATSTGSGKRITELVPIVLGKDPDKGDGTMIGDAHVHAVVYMKTQDMKVIK